VKPRLATVYLAAQALLIGASYFLPADGWSHFLVQVVVGWASALLLVWVVRQERRSGALFWYLLATGVFLNAAGAGAVAVLQQVFHVTSNPNVADFLFLGLYPCLMVALGMLIYRRSTDRELSAVMLSTLISLTLTVGLGMFGWEFMIWKEDGTRHISMGERVVMTAYPVADLMVLALLIHLLFLGYARNGAFRIILAAVACFFVTDVAWTLFFKAGTQPSASVQHLLEMGSMSAFAITGATVFHPAGEALLPRRRPGTRLSPGVVASLLLSLSCGPAVLLLETLLDQVYDVTGP
jgi:hypothetical protein